MKKLMALIAAMVILSVMMPTLSLGESTTADTAEPLTPVESLVDASGNVIFNDSIVEKAIRDCIGIPNGPVTGPVTKKQIAKLGSFRGGYLVFEISSETPQTVDLSILQLCPKLKILSLVNVTPKNWSAISLCKGLIRFSATHIKLKNLNFLLGLKSLSSINLDDSSCEDISAVTELSNLSGFACSQLPNDITPLYSSNIVSFSLDGLSDEQVNSLFDARGEKISYLYLVDTTLSDATLTRFGTLKIDSLILDNVTCSSISPFFAMKSLTGRLSLYNMKVESFEGIQNLKKISEVKLNNIQGITDYSPIYQLTKLKKLMISNCAAPNLQGIESLKELTWLTLDNVIGSIDITPIFTLKTLKELYLKNLKITSISGIEALKKLWRINFSGTDNIIDYSPLSKLKNLKIINVDDPSLLPEGLRVYKTDSNSNF